MFIVVFIDWANYNTADFNGYAMYKIFQKNVSEVEWVDKKTQIVSRYIR